MTDNDSLSIAQQSIENIEGTIIEIDNLIAVGKNPQRIVELQDLRAELIAILGVIKKRLPSNSNDN